MSVILVRHGETAMNAGGDSREALRGWIDAPLDKTGMAEASNIAQHLIGLPIARLHSSDLVRAVQTAQEISGALRMLVNTTPVFRPWDVGDLAGQPLKAVLPEMLRLIDSPKEKAPGGEAFMTFLDRFIPSIKPLVLAKSLYVVVAHARNTMVLEGMALGKGKELVTQVLRERGRVEPGGFIKVDSDWSYEIMNPKPNAEINHPKRLPKSAVLYIHTPSNSSHQCKDCALFLPKTQRCYIHGENDTILPSATCGYWVEGEPVMYGGPQGSVTKAESGYVDAPDGVSCKQCEYFIAPTKDCQKVDPFSEGDDPGFIHGNACCAAFSD